MKPTERVKLPTSDALSLITICLEGEFANQFKRFIDNIPMVQLRAELQHYLVEDGDSVFIDRLKDLRPDICVVDFDRDRERASRTAERIREALVETAIFAVSSNSQPDLIIRAMRSGCREYLIKPVDRDQLLEALARVGARRKEPREQLTGQILALLGAKGGAGVTTLGIHLGALLTSRYSRKTLLVDLHPYLGDASLYLALGKHHYHFYDLAENTHRLDAELLQGFLLRHPSGLEVLPSPDGFDVARQIAPDAVERTLEFLRAYYEFILVDCLPGLNEQNIAVIDHANQIYLVATPEIPALRNVGRYVDYFSRFDFPAEKVRIVINRHTKGGPITDAQIEKAIRKPIYWKVPNQYSDVMKTINTGNPLSLLPRSELSRNLSSWAEALAGQPPHPTTKKEGKSKFRFFGS